jgi:hypothetical protein
MCSANGDDPPAHASPRTRAGRRRAEDVGLLCSAPAAAAEQAPVPEAIAPAADAVVATHPARVETQVRCCCRHLHTHVAMVQCEVRPLAPSFMGGGPKLEFWATVHQWSQQRLGLDRRAHLSAWAQGWIHH